MYVCMRRVLRCLSTRHNIFLLLLGLLFYEKKSRIQHSWRAAIRQRQRKVLICLNCGENFLKVRFLKRAQWTSKEAPFRCLLALCFALCALCAVLLCCSEQLSSPRVMGRTLDRHELRPALSTEHKKRRFKKKKTWTNLKVQRTRQQGSAQLASHIANRI